MDSNVDKTNFVATIVIILLVSVPLALNPTAGAEILQASYKFIASTHRITPKAEKFVRSSHRPIIVREYYRISLAVIY